MSLYFAYILECIDGSLYTGITTDLTRRLREHQKGTGGAYTRAHGALRLRYSKEFPNRSEASKAEAAIKKLTREEKLFLCDTNRMK